VNKTDQQKKYVRLTFGKKESVRDNGSIKAFLLDAEVVIERHVTKTISHSALSQSGETRTRSVRTPHLSDLGRDLAELKKVVAALAVRSVVHEEQATDFDVQGMTVLDANTAYQMLDNPPEPTEALCNLLALR
jgi:hypothetical protein